MLAYTSRAIFRSVATGGEQQYRATHQQKRAFDSHTNMKDDADHPAMHEPWRHADTAGERAGSFLHTRPRRLPRVDREEGVIKDHRNRRRHAYHRQQTARVRASRRNFISSHKEHSTELPDLDAWRTKTRRQACPL